MSVPIPRVFVSYSHDDEDHVALVRRFAEFLRRDIGLDVVLDQWADGHRMDWSLWASRQLKAADYILAIASPAYRRRTDGEEFSHVGWGTQFEGAMLREQLNGNRGDNIGRILPVVLPGRSIEDIPRFLMPYSMSRFVVNEFSDSDDGVRELLAATTSNIGSAKLDFGSVSTRGSHRRQKALLTDELAAVSKGPDIRFSAASIGGTHYASSIIYRCSMFCSEPRGVVEYNLGRKYETFEAAAGVLDDATDPGQEGHFEVLLDGVAQQNVSARLGSPAALVVDVSGALRMQLIAYRTDTTVSPLLAGARLAGGLSNGLPELCWGNPSLYS